MIPPPERGAAERLLDRYQRHVQLILQEAAGAAGTVGRIGRLYLAGRSGVPLQEALTPGQFARRLRDLPRTWRDFSYPPPEDSAVIACLPAEDQAALTRSRQSGHRWLQKQRQAFYHQCIGLCMREEALLVLILLRWLVMAQLRAPRLARFTPQPLESLAVQNLADPHDDYDEMLTVLALREVVRQLLQHAATDLATVRGLVARVCIALRAGLPAEYGSDPALFQNRVADGWPGVVFASAYDEAAAYAFLGTPAVQQAYPHLKLTEWAQPGRKLILLGRRQRSQFVRVFTPLLAAQYDLGEDLVGRVASYLTAPPTGPKGGDNPV